MPQRDTSGIGERVPRALIDADLAVAFSFIDMAEEASVQGAVAEALLQKASRMLDDIRERLLHMSTAQKETFEPGCAKLAEALERAKARIAG
jgi:hypothetical protein